MNRALTRTLVRTSRNLFVAHGGRWLHRAHALTLKWSQLRKTTLNRLFNSIRHRILVYFHLGCQSPIVACNASRLVSRNLKNRSHLLLLLLLKTHKPFHLQYESVCVTEILNIHERNRLLLSFSRREKKKLTWTVLVTELKAITTSTKTTFPIILILGHSTHMDRKLSLSHKKSKSNPKSQNPCLISLHVPLWLVRICLFSFLSLSLSVSYHHDEPIRNHILHHVRLIIHVSHIYTHIQSEREGRAVLCSGAIRKNVYYQY